MSCRLCLANVPSARALELTLTCETDPVQSLLAVGTAEGRLFVFGGPAVEISWDVGRPVKIRHLAWRAGSGFLGVVGEFQGVHWPSAQDPVADAMPPADSKDTLSVYDLGRLEKGRPFRDSSLSMRSNITYVPLCPLLHLASSLTQPGALQLPRIPPAPSLPLRRRQRRHRRCLRFGPRLSRSRGKGTEPLVRPGGDFKEKWSAD